MIFGLLGGIWVCCGLFVLSFVKIKGSIMEKRWVSFTVFVSVYSLFNLFLGLSTVCVLLCP